MLAPLRRIKDVEEIALLRAAAMDVDTVAVASTGNAGSSTACLAAAMGLRAIVFVPETAPAAKLTPEAVTALATKFSGVHHVNVTFDNPRGPSVLYPLARVRW